jgi:hypothetical protein
MLDSYLIAWARYEQIELQCEQFLASVDFEGLPLLPEKHRPKLKRLRQRSDVAYRRVLEIEDRLSPEERTLLEELGLWV